MEPNTSCPSATRSTSAIVEQALSSMHAQSLHSLPSQGLVSASVSRSRSPAVGGGSLSVHGRATSQQPLPSAFFPALQAPAAFPFPTPLGGQPWQGLGLQSCPLPPLEQITVRPQSLMPFLSPSAGSGGLPPPRSSGDYRVGIAQLSSHTELPPLPASLRIPSLEETIASTYSITGGTIGGSMPWYCVDSSMDIGSSFSSLPVTPPPSSRGAGASTNFIGFAQPSSHTELAPLPASLQTPMLPVKQKPIDAIATPRDEDAVPQPITDSSTAMALSCETALKLPVESTPCHGRSSSVDVDHSSSTPKLLQQPLAPSSPRAGTSSSRSRSRSRSRSHVAARVIFSNAEREIIRKDKNLQELVNTDPRRVKRNISSRISAAKRKAMKEMHTIELKCKVQTLQRKYNTLSAELKSLQEQCAELEAGNKELSMTIKDMEQLGTLKDAESERLKGELKAVMRIKITNELQKQHKDN